MNKLDLIKTGLCCYYFQVNRPHGRGTAMLIGVNLTPNRLSAGN
ncbi:MULTISPECIES: hypothetical protein [unclassified Nostoc]|nr:hypothetical protein [Nostoc sp. DedQUE03]MDZ7974660.1 hypothetical protein [Nostoc sp. DedQUE03]MDZ8044395.1 hypothetical protein [Nostoc sp. DedQUE02]